ncbi:MAG: sce7726 family protein [Sulfurimonas sp.]|nr:sce7726 family protein [Sulfurimonas sp.]
MLRLNDKEIRFSLIEKLNNQSIKPKAIIEELSVHNGNAIADVVTLHNEAHCYEIKGDGDKIERILTQGEYYNLSFRKITLVTTNKHLQRAIKLAPVFWGIMVAEEVENKIILKYIRKAKNNPDFDKSVALLTLWKDEMLNLVQTKTKQDTKKSRAILAELIAGSKRKMELSQDITLTLLDRQHFNKYNSLAYK